METKPEDKKLDKKEALREKALEHYYNNIDLLYFELHHRIK
jgi:hypothetical protein